MMRSPIAAVMTASRPWRRPLASGSLVLLGALWPGHSLGAAPIPFPSQESLRTLQLTALACARENSAESCSKTRQLGDPLLDHPRLPANCKDLIWLMLDKAQPAAVNSFSRRDALASLAEKLPLVCRSSEQPPSTTATEQKPGSGGINFGGSQR